jgi:hypothetical protein
MPAKAGIYDFILTRSSKSKLGRKADCHCVLWLVLEWAASHRAELMEDWELCRQNQPPNMIEPLI